MSETFEGGCSCGAVRFKLTAPSEKGGWVLYTAFHNIAQPTADVSNVLKYLVLNL